MSLPLSARIRSVIAAAGRPLRCPEVQKHFPGENVPVAMGAMFRSGQLTRTGLPRFYEYGLGRPVKERRANVSYEQRLAERNARDRRAYASMSPEQHAAYLAKKYAGRPKPAPKPAKPARRPKSAPSIVIAPPSAVSYSARPPAPVARPETVDEWMARTGQQPERLVGFENVKPSPAMPVRGF